MSGGPSYRMTDVSLPETAHFGPAVMDRLSATLRAPIRDLVARPSKRIRARMVEIGYALAGVREEREPASPLEAMRIGALADALEAIHSGSLIVDDIQDNSAERRGEPCLHHTLGSPLALNAGNTLYFWPFEWIRRLELPESLELKLYRMMHATLFRAHLGQALDLGAAIDAVEQSLVPSLCLAAIELKTGELMSLALGAGATLAGAEPERLATILSFGRRFGMALQMSDDLGNLSLPRGASKRMEDLRLLRPTWAWAFAAANSTEDVYKQFVLAARALPDDAPMELWLREQDFKTRARSAVAEHAHESLTSLRAHLVRPKRYGRALAALDQAFECIATSYG